MSIFQNRRYFTAGNAFGALARLTAKLVRKSPTRPQDRIWTETFAWLPVFPSDERSLFWLETVWQRINPGTMRWEHRSFRSDAEKLREASDRRDQPPMIH